MVSLILLCVLRSQPANAKLVAAESGSQFLPTKNGQRTTRLLGTFCVLRSQQENVKSVAAESTSQLLPTKTGQPTIRQGTA